MSYPAVDWAVAQPLDNPAAKLVLLILAHHMNHKTGRCFPAVATIARESGLSDRGVRLAIARLAKLGMIEPRGSTTRRHYRLNVANPVPGAAIDAANPVPGAAIDAANPVPGAAIDAANPVPGAAIDAANPVPGAGIDAANPVPGAAIDVANPVRGAATPARGAGHSGTPCRLTGKKPGMNREGENAPPPQVNADGMKARTLAKPEEVARRRATLLAADWQPSAEGIAFAERRHPHVDWQCEARAFRDYWLAKPEGLSADWEASWRRWLDRATQFAARPSRPEMRNAGGDGLSPDALWLARVTGFGDRGFWLRAWGPRPGQDGCRVPVEILHQFGYAADQQVRSSPPRHFSDAGDIT